MLLEAHFIVMTCIHFAWILISFLFNNNADGGPNMDVS
jgi:hypothetical protein